MMRHAGIILWLPVYIPTILFVYIRKMAEQGIYSGSRHLFQRENHIQM